MQPPIYIISLKRTPERKLYIQRQLDALSLSYQFVEAIDKYDLSLKENRKKISEQVDISESDIEAICKRSRYIGAAACMLSHLKVYNLIIKNNIQMACILEDDGLILPAFPKILAVCSKVDWDIFMLSSQSSLINYIGRAFLRKESFKILRLLIYSYRLMRYQKYFPQLNFYTLRRIAQKISKHMLIKCLQHKHKTKDGRQENLREAINFALEIGALPTKDKTSWHKLMPRHYMANPFIGSYQGVMPISIISCMAYMLKFSAAIKWKQAATSLSKGVSNKPGYLSYYLEIDHIPRYLHSKGEINLNILVPPCVRSETDYLTYSNRI